MSRPALRRLLPLALAVALACGGGGGAPAPEPTPPARAASAADAWWSGAVVYQVFVRSFRDSGSDGIGDLEGLRSKLDYLNDGDPGTDADLGVDALWLMPIYPSPSYHGYDVTDLDGVDPDYGTVDDFRALVDAAHARGMKVILDFVPNHTSVEHPWFVESASSPASPRRGWYVWSATNPGWTQPFGGDPSWHARNRAWYYGAFWSGMPDLNWRSPEVVDAVTASALGWLGRGADGFRLDAVRFLVEDGPGAGQQDTAGTHAALKAFVAAVREAAPEALVVGEAWADVDTIASYYGSTEAVPGGDELPLAFDFPLAAAILDGVSRESAGPIAGALDAMARAYPPGAAGAPFLSNHDQRRAASVLGTGTGRSRVAASILLTLQGTPFLYYGEEVGQRNGTCPGDECKRTPFAWDATAGHGFSPAAPWWPFAPDAATASVAAQTGDPGSLLSRYRALIRVRKASPALQRGGTARLPAGEGVLAYLRTLPGETVLVAHNVRGARETVSLPGAPGAAAVPLLADEGATATPLPDGGWRVSLPAFGSGVFRLE